MIVDGRGLVTVILKIVGYAGAIVCFYCAAFLYEDEEGKLQNTLEKWSQQLRSQQNTALNRHALLMQRFAVAMTQWLDAIFGKRLLSAKAVVASGALSLSGVLWEAFFSAWMVRCPSRLLRNPSSIGSTDQFGWV